MKQTLRAWEIEEGDKITLNDGSIVTVKTIGKGIYPKSKLITWGNGQDDWSCVPDSTKLEVDTKADWQY